MTEKVVSVDLVVPDDTDAVEALQVFPDQLSFVAPNAVSLKEFEDISGGYTFTIRSDGKIVGFMGLIDAREHDQLDEGDDPNAAYLVRMMISHTHQGQGIGRVAMEYTIDWARARKNTAFRTSVVQGNTQAEQFYAALGLTKTGRIVDDEIEMQLDF